MTYDEPRLILGGRHVDGRGSVSFVNDFNFKGVERFYSIRCSRADEPRGWVGHQRDRKWFTVLQGQFLVAIVRPDNWATPSGTEVVQRYVLDADRPGVLFVPARYATAQMSLTADAILTVFSSGTIAQAKEDDFRFPLSQWKVTAGE